MKKILVLATLICALAIPTSAQDEVYLDSVIGLDPVTGGIFANWPFLEFVFNFRVQSGEVETFKIGHRIYSPEGATWTITSQSINPIFSSYFTVTSTSSFSVTGSGADTIGISGPSSYLQGDLPIGFDSWAYKISIKVPCADIGKTLCIDSSYFPPNGFWNWHTSVGDISPVWEGPYCFEIVGNWACSYESGDVMISSIEGLNASKTGLVADIPIKYTINHRHGYTITGMTNGFRFYSPDGATWEIPVLDTIPGIAGVLGFDGGVFINYFSVNGSGADTMGLGGFSLFSYGPEYLDQTVAFITTSVSTSDAGKTLCLDSTFYPPNSVWLWATYYPGPPTWDGPHCYEIVASCCEGMSGDMNYDDALDISDVTYLVNWMFKSGPDVYCLDEANVDGVASIDISDLTYFVNYFFKGGDPPVTCP